MWKTYTLTQREKCLIGVGPFIDKGSINPMGGIEDYSHYKLKVAQLGLKFLVV